MEYHHDNPGWPKILRDSDMKSPYWSSLEGRPTSCHLCFSCSQGFTVPAGQAHVTKCIISSNI